MKALIVFSTVSKEEDGVRLARTLVEEKLAACVNLVPRIRSFYRWKGEVQDDQETLLIIKTTENNYTLLEERLKTLHGYELPEIVAVTIDQGEIRYLGWLAEMCGKNRESR